jgi:hypothetical protein
MTSEFERDLTALLNRHSEETRSDTPDFLLASFLIGCLATFNRAVKRRETWYGRDGLRFPPRCGEVVDRPDG